MSKKALGKGIGALLGDLEDAGAGDSSGVVQVPVESLKPNTYQPRELFPESTLDELADSIREKGVLQPLLVEREGEFYSIVAGERRLRAAKKAGLKEIPVLVRNSNQHEKLEVALIENIQREDLTPVEEAKAYEQLIELSGLSQEEVARRVGKKRSTIANSLRLLKLPKDMLKSLNSGEISAGHARAILSVVDPSNRINLYNRVKEKDLSVRQTESAASLLNEGIKAPSWKTLSEKQDAELEQIEERLIDLLGTKVKIRGNLKKGQIQVSYFSGDDLERIIEILGLKRF
jgi:ParB family chromosome partitioning protein